MTVIAAAALGQAFDKGAEDGSRHNRAGVMPDLADLRARFAPDPEALPQVTVTLTPLSAYDVLTAAPTEEAPA